MQKLSINVHSIEGVGENDVSGVACVHKDFSYWPSLNICFDDHGIGVWIALEIYILLRECNWHVRPLCLYHWSVYQDAVNLPEIIPSLPLVFKVKGGTPGDRHYHAEGG